MANLLPSVEMDPLEYLYLKSVECGGPYCVANHQQFKFPLLNPEPAIGKAIPLLTALGTDFSVGNKDLLPIAKEEPVPFVSPL